jgi:glutamine amidotransferase
VKVAIIDYGSGNLRSAAKALGRAARESSNKTEITVTANAGDLDTAERIVLPGVGAFGDCMAGLGALDGMLEALEHNVIAGGKPFLGICVGMQLMAARGVEHGVHGGLGWITGEIAPLEPVDPELKIPHMGWNDLVLDKPEHPILHDIPAAAHVYFVHGYGLRDADPAEVVARVDYGGNVVAIVGRDNLVGTQFHPEKSQQFGLTILRNFLGWRP